MTLKHFPISPEENQTSVASAALQQTFTGRGFDLSSDSDREISVAVLDAMDAIQRERNTRRAGAFGRLEARSTKCGQP